MTLLANATWEEIESLRERIQSGQHGSLEDAGQHFASLFVEQFSSLALARVFAVLPFATLSEPERTFASALVRSDRRLTPETPVLTLLGTRGREPDWNERQSSRGHRAIPLLDRTYVSDAPMIAKLLADLEVDLAGLDDGRPIATRRMLGGDNGTFYVEDAQSACDAANRPIIAARDFVARHRVLTVFGMGGAYLDGTLAVAIFFSTERLTRLAVDRFPSFISIFKMATTPLVQAKRIFNS